MIVLGYILHSVCVCVCVCVCACVCVCVCVCVSRLVSCCRRVHVLKLFITLFLMQTLEYWK